MFLKKRVQTMNSTMYGTRCTVANRTVLISRPEEGDRSGEEMTNNQNLKAFLQMIAWSEIGPELLAESDDGYNVIVGSRPGHADLFTDYSDHPRKLIDLGNGLKSTAAGRYQILKRYFDSYKKTLALPDFSPDSQDKIALQMIKECRALDLINNGNIVAAIVRCASRWASLPGNTYQQHMHAVEDLVAAYKEAGGLLV